MPSNSSTNPKKELVVSKSEQGQLTRMVDAPRTQSAVTKPSIPLILGKRVMASILSHPMIFGVCCLLTGVAAFGASTLMAQKSWEATSTLLYTPLPIPEESKGLYTAPDLKTLTTLVNSTEILEQLKTEFKLPMPAKLLDNSLTVVVPSGTKMINLLFRWGDQKQTPLLLNRLTEFYIEHVAELRRRKLTAHIADFEASLAKTQVRLDQANQSLRDFHRRERLTSYAGELLQAKKQVFELESSLTEQKRNEAEVLAQMKRMEEHLAEVKDQTEREVQTAQKVEASVESLADNRRRQDRLRELIQEERRINEVQIQLENKLKELRRAELLYQKKAATRAEVEILQAEAGALSAKIKEGEKIVLWQLELDKLDKMMVPVAGTKKRVTSPIFQQAMFRKLEMELQLTGIREELSQINSQLETQLKRIERIELLASDYDALSKKIEAIEDERKILVQSLSAMKQLRDLKTGEFAIAALAKESPYPVSSNKKTVLMVTSAAGLAITLALLLGINFVEVSRTVDARAKQLGLPILARFQMQGPSARRHQMRGLTLRIRRSLAQAGDILLFTTLSSPSRSDGLIQEFAECLALSDERVVILDARIHRAGWPALYSNEKSSLDIANQDSAESARANLQAAEASGNEHVLGLTDYLAFVCNELDQFRHLVKGQAVDWIACGQSEIPAESLATHRMRELIEKLRREYTMVLIIGPSLNHSVDLQILSAYAQGVVPIVDSPSPIGPDVKRTLRELDLLGVPLIGQIVLDLAHGK
jgi:Mrp family chromosome partitioning ATPase